MNNKLFFLILSAVLVVLSIITICTAPNINKKLFSGNENCQAIVDAYKYLEKQSDSAYELTIKYNKQDANLCKRRNAMYSLEYASLIIDLCLGTLCCLLGLLHYFDKGNYCIPVTGIIGLASGAIGFILTIVYLGYSAYIFNNDYSEDDYLLYDNGAYAKLENNQYVTLFKSEDSKDNKYYNYAKYKDLGKKQYNYNSELFIQYQDQTSDFYKCKSNSNLAGLIIRTKDNSLCPYIWKTSYYSDYNNYIRKKRYDRWLTSIIFSAFILLCDIGVAVFGLFLFLNKGDSSGHTPM